MKQVLKLKKLLSGFALSAVLMSSVATAYAAPAQSSQTQTPPANNLVSGPQAKAPFEPGSQDAKSTPALGNTQLVPTKTDGTPLVANRAEAGSVAGVDFQAHIKYCSRNLLYTPVKNTTAVTKYLQVRVYNQSGYRDIYTSVAANSTAYPAYYGIDGTYTAYLYVWNGSTYQYDEYVTSTLTCNVSVSRVYNAGGWVELKIQNLGNAYASQVSSELAPTPATGTYTGTHYDYPVAGGAAIYRWFQVGTSPYGISSYTAGSFNPPVFFTGDL